MGRRRRSFGNDGKTVYAKPQRNSMQSTKCDEEANGADWEDGLKRHLN